MYTTSEEVDFPDEPAGNYAHLGITSLAAAGYMRRIDAESADRVV